MFLTTNAKKAFAELRQAFIKAPILNHFDLKHYIQIKTDALGYVIGRIFSQLTLDNLGRCYLIAFFFRKMIPAKTRYETHNGELLAIVEAFKTWKHYLEGCKQKVLILTNHNNLQYFIDTKNLSSKQV